MEMRVVLAQNIDFPRTADTQKFIYVCRMRYATHSSIIYFSVNDKTQFSDKRMSSNVPHEQPNLNTFGHNQRTKQKKTQWAEEEKRKTFAICSTAQPSESLTIFPNQFTMDHVNIIRIYTSFSSTNRMKLIAVHLSSPMHRPRNTQHFTIANFFEAKSFTYRNCCLFGFLSFR